MPKPSLPCKIQPLREINPCSRRRRPIRCGPGHVTKFGLEQSTQGGVVEEVLRGFLLHHEELLLLVLVLLGVAAAASGSLCCWAVAWFVATVWTAE